MQNLRRIIFCLLFATLDSFCGELSVCTWNLEWFPSGSSKGFASKEIEFKRTSTVAETLSKLNCDILILQEVRDIISCEQLVEALKPLNYTISVCTQFKEGFGGAVGLQQIAILSKQQATASWAENWNTVNISDPPRGFAFASFRIGTNDIGVYGVHLKSNLTRGDVERGRQLNILKRELAAEKVMRHINESPFNSSNQLEVVIVGGDFNTTLDQNEFASERTLTIFADNQFETGYDGVELKQRITIPGKGKYPDATFDYLFVRPKSISSKPSITPVTVSDHYPVVWRINLQD
jgi:endonuclease/exonuclease/phosphatase family metal-dependent hydrolase